MYLIVQSTFIPTAGSIGPSHYYEDWSITQEEGIWESWKVEWEWLLLLLLMVVVAENQDLAPGSDTYPCRTLSPFLFFSTLVSCFPVSGGGSLLPFLSILLRSTNRNSKRNIKYFTTIIAQFLLSHWFWYCISMKVERRWKTRKRLKNERKAEPRK